MRDGDKEVIRHALATHNAPLLDGLVFAMTFVGVPEEEITRELEEALSEMPEETVHFWGGPCNCQGDLN